MIEKKLEKIVKIILYLIFFIPLIFIEGFFYPFIITKTVFFRLLIQIAFSLYLLLMVIDFKRYKPKFNFALVLVGIFLLINFIFAIFGYDFYKSFWSSFERMEGIIGLIYLTIYLFLLINFLKTKKEWLISIRVILFVSLLVSLYGLIQKFNILPVFEAGIGRATSTLGNAAFLAGFLLLTIGLGIYYYFVEENKKYKIFALVAIGLNFIVLLLTATRGAIIGLFIGIFVFLLLNVIFRKGKIRKYSFIFFIAIIIIATVFYLTKDSLANSKIDFVRRVATISINDSTVKNRLLVWKWAISESKENIWFGVGLENFNVVYNEYFTPEVNEDWFDRTHNIYLDQLISSGIFGLVAYLAILGYLFFKLFKIRRKNYLLFSVLSSLLVAYGVHNFFVFDILSTALIHFFLIGFISFECSIDQVDIENNKKTNKPFIINLVILLLIFANLYTFYYLVYLPFKINRNLYIGYYYTLADTELSYISFSSALFYKFGSTEAACQLYKMFNVLISEPTTSAEDAEKFYKLTREKLKFACDNYPLDIRTKLYLGQLIINNYKNTEDLNEAEKLLSDSVRLSPGRPEASYLLFNVYLKKQDEESAKVVLENLVNELPWFGEAKIMLAYLIRKSDPQEAEKYFNDGIKQVYGHSSDNIKKIIEYMLDAEKYQEVIPYYLELINIEPNRYDYRVDLSKIYYLVGDLDNAVEEINIINSKAPEILEDYQDYLNLLFNAYNQDH